jgi:hypothetical protein
MKTHYLTVLGLSYLIPLISHAVPQGKPVDFPPIPEGYYAFGVSCKQAIAEGTRGDPPPNLIRFHRKAFQEAGGGPVISRFTDMGDGTYRVFARSYGNGEDDVGKPDNFNITLIGNDAFRVENNMSQHYTHCPLGLVPKSLREDWFEF